MIPRSKIKTAIGPVPPHPALIPGVEAGAGAAVGPIISITLSLIGAAVAAYAFYQANKIQKETSPAKRTILAAQEFQFLPSAIASYETLIKKLPPTSIGAAIGTLLGYLVSKENSYTLPLVGGIGGAGIGYMFDDLGAIKNVL